MNRTIALLSPVAALFFPLAAAGQDTSTDEAQIRAVVQDEGDAWNRGDAKGFGAHYAQNGSLTNVLGQQLYGREAFVAQHAKIFSTVYKGSRNSLSVAKITFLRPDVALVEIDGSLSGIHQLPLGLETGEDGALHVKLLEVMTKEAGSWWIAAFHNVAVMPPPAPPQAK